MKFIELIRILREESIARRYLIINSFDGALAVLGVVIAMFFLGVDTPILVIMPCLGAGVAMAVSGIWGSYAAERAERLRDFHELESYMLRTLEETDIEDKMKRITFLVAVVDGASSFVVTLILIAPFVIFPLGIAFYASVFLAFLVLFVLGVVVGKIGEENLVKSGIKMVLAGVVVSIILYVLEMIKVV